MPITEHQFNIKIRDVEKSFGSHKVLDGVNLDIACGETMVILGKSGTGKSVLFQCILGFITPDKGSILIDGDEMVGAPPSLKEKIRQKIGILFQNAALFDSMTVLENIIFGLNASSKEVRKLPYFQKEKRAFSYLKKVGFDAYAANLMPSELSGGMQRRIGLARSMACGANIQLFDEPTSGLDPVMSTFIATLIAQSVKEKQATSLTITHDMKTAHILGRSAAMLYEGKIIWKGESNDIFTSDNPYLYQFSRGLMNGPINMT